MYLIKINKILLLLLSISTSMNGQSLKIRTGHTITLVWILFPTLVYAAIKIKPNKQYIILCLIFSCIGVYQFKTMVDNKDVTTEKYDIADKKNDQLSKIIEEEYDAYRSKQSNKDENFSLSFCNENDKKYSLQEIRRIMNDIINFFGTKHQRSSDDLHKFCGIASGMLGFEYLLLKILKRSGFNKIKTVFIIDTMYDQKKGVYKECEKRIIIFQKEIKNLFPEADIKIFSSCDYFPKNFDHSFIFYRTLTGNGATDSINKQIFYIKQNSLFASHSPFHLLPSMQLEQNDIDMILKNLTDVNITPFDDILWQSSARKERLFKKYRNPQYFFHYFSTIFSKMDAIEFHKNYNDYKKVVQFFQIFAQFLKNINNNRLQLNEDMKMFIRSGNQWIKENLFDYFCEREKNNQIFQLEENITCKVNSNNKEAFEWCASNSKKYYDEIAAIIQ